MRVGVGVEAVGQQDPRAQKHVLSPEPAQHVALEAHELEPLLIGRALRQHLRVAVRVRNRRNHLVERDLHRGPRRRIKMNLQRLVIRIARLPFQCWPSPLSGGSHTVFPLARWNGS